MRFLVVGACLVAMACEAASGPAAISRGQDACAQCRMVIVTQSTAAQIVSPGEEPRLFDEIGCLRDYLSTRPTLPAADTMIYVADHQTGAWVDVERALFTRTVASTPMATGLLAHADPASRDADLAARGGTPISSQQLFGRALRSAAR